MGYEEKRFDNGKEKCGMSRGKFEIIVIADRVYTYPTTWKLLKLTARHIGERFKREIVSVRLNGQPFMTVFTGYGM